MFGSRPKNQKPANEKLNSRTTLIVIAIVFSASDCLNVFWNYRPIKVETSVTDYGHTTTRQNLLFYEAAQLPLAQPKNKFYYSVLFQLANIGHQLKEEIERVLTMISQFAFIHGDTNLLCLALLRRPPEPPLTLGKVVDTKYFKH